MLPKKKHTSSPGPGRPARGTRSGRPLMVFLDLIGRRWALRVIWELREEALTFRDLQARCGGLSPSVLNRRLGELRDARIVESGDGGYQLSGHGKKLIEAFRPLNQWVDDWARDPR